MRRIVVGISLILMLGLAAAAQKQVSSSKNISRSTAGSAVRGGDSATIDAGTSLDAQLAETLDVKKARVGDEVVLKVVRAVKQDGQTIVPKGAQLVGRVTEVQQRTKNNAVSKLGVVFDKVRGENLEMPITATISAITSSTVNAGASDALNSDISGTSGTDGRVIGQSSTRNSGSGGLLGGVTNTAGGVLGTTTNAVGNTAGTVAGTAKQTVGSSTQALGQTIHGLQISPSAGADASANGSTTISSADKNVRLEKGVNFQLRVSGN